jgi:hypothetical protein
MSITGPPPKFHGTRDILDAPGDVTFPSIWPTTASNAHRVKPVKLVPYG